MSRPRVFDPWRAVVVLDAQVTQARLDLQRTAEVHPAFERRVKKLMSLVEKRDRALWPPIPSGEEGRG
jgi:hypothetical protein